MAYFYDSIFGLSSTSAATTQHIKFIKDAAPIFYDTPTIAGELSTNSWGSLLTTGSSTINTYYSIFHTLTLEKLLTAKVGLVATTGDIVATDGNITTTKVLNTGRLYFTGYNNYEITCIGGSGSNSVGRSITIQSGIGTGSSTPSEIIFRTPTIGSSGVTAQSVFERLTINSTGIQVVGSATISNGLTVTTGGLTVTAGGLTVTAGGLTVTAGGLTVTAGNTTLTSLTASTVPYLNSSKVLTSLANPTSGYSYRNLIYSLSKKTDIASGVLGSLEWVPSIQTTEQWRSGKRVLISTTLGNNIITITDGDTSLLRVGQAVTGNGIPNDTTITYINDGTSFTISKNASATTSGYAQIEMTSNTNYQYVAPSNAKTLYIKLIGWSTLNYGLFEPTWVSNFQILPIDIDDYLVNNSGYMYFNKIEGLGTVVNSEKITILKNDLTYTLNIPFADCVAIEIVAV